MSYTAVVCKINIRPFPNRDFIVLGDCLGYQVIIGKEIKDGDLGIFFESDGQLSEEFCEKNNLIGVKNHDGTRTGGLFKDNRRVKAIKISGQRSEGFWIPLNSVEYTGVKLDSLKEGDQFVELNGHAICNKYITPATQRALDNATKTKSRGNNFHITLSKKSWKYHFPKHIDTGHFKKELGRIPVGATIYISEKMHGCLAYNSTIQMADGTIKNIFNVKQGDVVLGYKDNKIVPSKVLQKFDGGKAEKWLNVKIDNSLAKGNSYLSIKCTPEHWFYLLEKDTYIPAKELKYGDKVLFKLTTQNLTEQQKQVAIGKMLGDGSIKRFNSGFQLEFGHKELDEDYVNLTVKALGDLGRKNSYKRTSGHGTKIVTGVCRTNYFVMKEFESWYSSENKKIVPSTLEFTPMSLAFWYMDDGSLSHSEDQQDRALFAVCGFDDTSCLNIQKALTNIGLDSVIYKSGNYNRIRLNKDSADQLFQMIKEYIPPCMERKLPVKYRGQFNPAIFKEEKNILIDIPEVYRVRAVEDSPETKSERYDMETETHNYFAHNILVHNTSHRISNIPVKETSAFVNFLTNVIWKVNSSWALKFKDKFTKEQFRVLHGTRNTVLNEEFFTKNGFYGGDAFRRNACRHIIPNKNEVIYGEIVGYTTMGRGIMQDHDLTKLSNKALIKKFGNKISYSYGEVSGLYEPEPSWLEYGSCSFYIYRITRINEAGVQEELSWPEVVKRAKELNTLTIRNLIEPFEYDGDKEKLSALVEEIVNGKSGSDAFPSTYTDKHIMEGVVVRFEKDGQVGWLKEKSFVFKVLEGICKESEDYVDMEESA